jgi:hypothetical protein
VSEATRKNISLAATGRILTEKDKNKISNSRLGVKLSDETRAKLSMAATCYSYKFNYFKNNRIYNYN